MQYYLELGHMEPVHQTKFVIYQSDTSQKKHVVFDASTKTSNGFSLNNK